MSMLEEKEIKQAKKNINSILSGQLLRVDNKAICIIGSSKKLLENFEKLNKRIRNRAEKGLIEEGREINLTHNLSIQEDFLGTLEDVINNPKKYKGRVFLGNRELLNEREEISGDIKYLIKNIIKLKNSGKANHYLENYFETLEFDRIEFEKPNDWEIKGVIKSSELGGFSIHSLKEDFEIPERFHNLTEEDCENCDHCRKARKRNQVFILENDKTGEIMQVGGSCMKDFVDMRGLNSVMQVYERFIENLSQTYERNLDIVSKTDFVANVLAAIESDGGEYKKTLGKTPIDFKFGTKDKVIYKLSSEKRYGLIESARKQCKLSRFTEGQTRGVVDDLEKQFKFEVNESHYALATEIINYYKDNRKELVKNSYNEFDINAVNRITSESDLVDINYGQVGFIALAVKKFLVEKELIEEKRRVREENKVAPIENSVFIAEEKTKLGNICGEVLSVKEKYVSGFSYYDSGKYILMFTMRDLDSQKTFKVKISNYDLLENEAGEDIGAIKKFYEGKAINLSGSVKSVDFEGDNGRVQYSEVMRVSSLGKAFDYKEEPEHIGGFEINGKINVLNLQFKSVEEDVVYIDQNNNTTNKFNQYLFEDENGLTYVLNSVEKLDLKEGDFYAMGAKSYPFGEYRNIYGFNRDLLVKLEIDNVEQLENNNDLFTFKQAQKQLGVSINKRVNK